MKKPRFSTLIIASQFVLLLACVAFTGILFWHNYVLKVEAKKYAEQVGAEEARRNFLRGEYILYELKVFQYRDNSGRVPDEGEIMPAGRTDGQCQVYYYLVSSDMPKVYREIQQAFVDGYNGHMRLCFEHPEWFDKNGDRIPMHELRPSTNPPSSAI